MIRRLWKHLAAKIQDEAGAVVEAYCRKLKVLDRGASVWKDTELPHPKSAIKKAILDKLGLFRDSDDTEESRDMRRALVHCYIKLARFVPPDDAQLLNRSEKVSLELGEKLLRHGSHTRDDYRLLRQLETPMMRISKKIAYDERQAIAEIAAFNSGWSVEETPEGYAIKGPAMPKDGP